MKLSLAVLALLAMPAAAADAPADPSTATWLRPPQAILDVLHAPEPPVAWLSPADDTLALATPVRYPPIEELARTYHALAGLRVDPKAHALHGESWYGDLALVRVADGTKTRVELPRDVRLTRFRWSADGKRFAFANRAQDALELWTGETATGEVRRVEGLRVNPLLGSEIQWMPDQRTLLVKRVPQDVGAPPEKPAAPPGPKVQETSASSPTSTYEARDVLTGPHDEALFEHFSRSQLVLVDAASGRVTPFGEPALYGSVTPSPDGRHVLVDRVHRPFSYSLSWWRFPRDTEVWSDEADLEHVVVRRPLLDRVPIHGVEEGPRSLAWRQTAPATLIWVEALDGGDPGRKAERRDRVLLQAAPFAGEPREIHRAAHRVQGWSWGEKDGLVVLTEYERERRWRHVHAVDADAASPTSRILWDVSVNERYRDPGSPMERTRHDGTRVLLQDGDSIFLQGDGSTPEGDRPFLDRFSLTKRTTERLFRSEAGAYERVIDVLDVRAGSLLTRRESPQEPPHYVARRLGDRVEAATGEATRTSSARALTSFEDPTPQLRAIQKRIVRYERADGVPLSFTLYLPPGYREGTRLPTVAWAYPMEYSDPVTAGQVSGTDRQFTRIMGASQLFFLLDGYAVLNDVTMPVIGDPDTAYDTFVEQLVLSARAAVDAAVALGVTDPERVGVGGHSHGALMTATLLAHSDLFRAGIARSGAYNHTMRPFGFQSERRTLWKAPESYVRLSPVMHADRINEPLLLVHGQVDQNPGTVPLQSEKLYESIRGTGGTARLVMLPHESHGYQSREAVEHVIAEQLAWFDRYVKRAPPRAELAAGQ